MNSNVVKVDFVQQQIISEQGLALPSNWTMAQHEELFDRMAAVMTGCQWATGDGYNWLVEHGKSEDEIKSFLVKRNIKLKTAQIAGDIATRFPLSASAERPQFTFAKLVYMLEDHALADELLNRASREKLSVAKLKIEKDKALGTYAPPIDSHHTDIDDALAELLDGLPKKWADSVKGKIKALYRNLKKQYAIDLENAVNERVKQIKNEAEALKESIENERKELQIQRHGLRTLISKKEFRLIMGLLHPDKHSGDSDLPRYEKAFQALRHAEEMNPYWRV